MWRFPEYQIDNTYVNIAMAATSYHRVSNGIHVLLADHDHKFLTSTAEMLKRHFYKVTMVDCASTALAILTQKEEKFDAVIANIHSPDLQGFKLLRQAVSMDLLVIMLCDQEDAEMAVRLIDHGAFALLEKTICQGTLKSLWQHVLRERNKRSKEIEKIRDVMNNIDKGKGVMRPEENTPNTFENGNYKGKGKRSRQCMNDAQSQSTVRVVKRKTCTEWTVELHEKFMDAVHQLGDGKCYPKEILELMNVPGLTRMQVASHLQKCRNDNWRAPEERKAPPSNVSPASGSASRPEQRRFGSMPRLTAGHTNSGQQQNLSRQNTRSPEAQSSPSINGVVTVDRQYLTIGATFASKVDASSPQSVVQPAGPQAQIVGSVNYRSGGVRVGAQNGDVWVEGNNGGVLNGVIGGNFYGGEKDEFSDDPSNTTTGDDSNVTPPPPPPLRHHRRLQSDEFLNFNDEEYEYLMQDFSDNNHARQGVVGLQANNNNSSSSQAFNIVPKEAKGQTSEMLNIPTMNP